jgi:hypothetical protein
MSPLIIRETVSSESKSGQQSSAETHVREIRRRSIPAALAGSSA